MKILDESYYDDLLKDLEEIFREQQKDVIAIICARLRAVGQLNPTSAKQLARMAKYQNADLKEIEKVIKKANRMAEKEIDAIFEQAAESSREYAEVLAHTAGGGTYEANVQSLMAAAAREYKNMVLNLPNTYAFKTDGKVLSIRQQYIKAVNKAVSAVSTGTLDYNTAIRQTVKQMVDSGLRTRQRTGEKVLEWPESGYTRRVDSSVRMNVLEGVRRMNQAVLDDAAEKYATGYEISAHDRPAPDHADIQGKQYMRADYENLNASLARPIGTLNCMHIAFPIIYGVSKPTYTEEQLAAMKRNAEKEYTWKGKTLTGYECTQMQRKYETAIRRAKEQDVAFRQVGNDLDAKRARKRVRELTKEYRSFSDHVGLTAKLDRTAQEGYNKTKEIVHFPVENRLPNSLVASTGQNKIQGYLLNSHHPVGQHKARVFDSVLGYNEGNWDILSDKIYKTVQFSSVSKVEVTSYGVKHIVPMRIYGEKKKSMVINTVWQTDKGSNIPRLITATFDKNTIRKEE